MQRCKAVCKAVVSRHCYAVPIEMVVRGAGRELLPFILTEVVTPLTVNLCENRHYINDSALSGIINPAAVMKSASKDVL